MSLPATYAALARNEITSFRGLRPRQRHPWSAFLTQLGAMALNAAGESNFPEGEQDWREMIRGLTADFPGDEPWTLVASDPTAPAFMQAPSPSREDYEASFFDMKKKGKPPKSETFTPRGVDMLFASNNHDTKAKSGFLAGPDEWLYAPLALQTASGYMGRGRQRISRMNGGCGNRSALSLSPSLRWGMPLSATRSERSPAEPR